MLRLRALVLIVAAACSAPARSLPRPIVVLPSPPSTLRPAALDPPQPALRLPRNFVPTAYAPRLVIDPAGKTFAGELTITGTISERSATIWLHGRHLVVTRAQATGAETVDLTVTPRGEDLLEIHPAVPLDAGTWQLHFIYTGALDELDTTGAFEQTVGGDHYVFSQLEAVYARRVFPCFDEPDIKVPWTVTLDVPSNLVAVSNATEVKTTPLDATHKRVEFAPTQPLPSYLVAFGVGPFELVDAGKTKSGVPVRIIALHGRAADAAFAASVTAKVLDALEAWFDRPYPFGKLDIMTVPITIGFSAMENAGLVTFSETSVLFDPKQLSWGRRHRYTLVAAHELSHQWFGDLVTTAWWDDIWLNEGFADWMERKIVMKLDPEWHDDLADFDERQGALGADSLVSARRIRQPIATPDDILDVFDGITYAKGASVLSMFENYLGPDVFQRGVRAYIASRAFAAATSADFIAAISAAAGRDVGPAFSSFLEQSGAPQITAAIACGKNERTHVTLTQRRYVEPGSPPPPPGKPWIVPVCVAYDQNGARGEACTLLSETTGTIELDAKLRGCPRWLEPNAGAHGYYRMALDATQATALRDEAWPLLTWTERRDVYAAVAQQADLGQLPLTLAISLVPRMLAGADRFTVGDAVGLPAGLDSLVADDQRPIYDAWLKKTFGPGAVQLGLMPKPADDYHAESMRQSLIGIAARAGEPTIVAEAVKLAAHYHELPTPTRGQVLAIAADHDPAVFAELLHDVHAEPDRARRGELIGAVAGVHDLAEQQQALALVLDPSLDARETLRVLYYGPTDANRAAAATFTRANLAAIMARLPQDETAGSVRLAGVFTAACRADQRDAIAAYVQAQFGKLPGSPRMLAQEIEAMDQCIARRARLGPAVRGWLGGIKANAPTGIPPEPARPARSPKHGKPGKSTHAK